MRLENIPVKWVLLIYGYIAAFLFFLGFQFFRYFSEVFWSPSLTRPRELFLYFDTYYQEYSKILISFLIATLLCVLLFVVSLLLSISNKKEYEKASEYECGFEPFDSATRQPFDVHFYIVGILFLIFDVEVALLFPWAVGLNLVGQTGFWSMVIFLVILTIGFVYEWQRGALSWPHPTLDLKSE